MRHILLLISVFKLLFYPSDYTSIIISNDILAMISYDYRDRPLIFYNYFIIEFNQEETVNEWKKIYVYYKVMSINACL